MMKDKSYVANVQKGGLPLSVRTATSRKPKTGKNPFKNKILVDLVHKDFEC